MKRIALVRACRTSGFPARVTASQAATARVGGLHRRQSTQRQHHCGNHGAARRREVLHCSASDPLRRSDVPTWRAKQEKRMLFENEAGGGAVVHAAVRRRQLRSIQAARPVRGHSRARMPRGRERRRRLPAAAWAMACRAAWRLVATRIKMRCPGCKRMRQAMTSVDHHVIATTGLRRARPKR